MDIRLKAPLLGAVIVGAAAIGAHMGESAIAQINPLYYQGAAVHPRDRGAAVDDVMRPSQAERFADHYGWAEGQTARLADCIDCAALTARDRFAAEQPVHYAVIETAYRPDPQPVYAEERLEPQPEPVFVIETPEVERYAHYPIEEKPEKPEPEAYAAVEE
jgi:hypothetical protein